jgi:micrococcal nuclease
LKIFFLLISIFIIPSILVSKIELRIQNQLFCYDGDTCYVNVWYLDNPEPKQEKIRLLKLDTPEISKPKCEKERELAYKARDFINNLIDNAKEIKIITNYDRGSYGRILADIEIDQLNVSELLIKNNLGVIYDKNNKSSWCNIN